jgi:ribonucleoside-triphosphate reductase
MPLPTLYQEYIHKTHYARWIPELGRREHWEESVERYVDFMVESALASPGHYKVTDPEREYLYSSYVNLRAVGSMRGLQTAGEAARRDNAAIYNCCAVAIDDQRAFDEALYLLMCGCGVGFSVERQFIRHLPEVPDHLFESLDTLVVEDSRRHWASSYRRLLAALWAGHIPKWDTSLVRKAGEPLKTFGGRASGPGPLEDLFRYTIEVYRGARGRRLTSLECHGLMCKIGEIVVAGGTRRSALISLSNPSDDRMRDAKSGDWRSMNPHYRMANNSAVWEDKPDAGRFMREWLALYESKSGERGIINRKALQAQAAREGRRDPTQVLFVNPCVEIGLRNGQMCNLSEVIARHDDDLESLMDKVRCATIFGTIQASITNFAYIRPKWRENCEEERLLGVSITGQMDHPVLQRTNKEAARWWHELADVYRATNTEWAEKLCINEAAAGRCQKPSGTVSQLANCGSGGHARKFRFGVRRTRESMLDPAAQVVKASGVPCEQDAYDQYSWVFEWPMESPPEAIVVEDQTAISQLERWRHVRNHWCDHNPSASIEIREDEWMEAGAWVYNHFDEVGGLAFFPAEEGGHSYTQLPFEATSEEEFKERVAKMPKEIHWENSTEKDDQTKGSREVACAGNACEVVGLGDHDRR